MSFMTACFTIVSVCFIALVYEITISVKQKNSTDLDYNGELDILDNLLLFSPFVVLFYVDSFWLNLSYLAAIIAAVAILRWMLYKFGVYKYPPTLVISTGPGSFFLVIIIYYSIFHEGALSTSSSGIASGLESSETGSTNSFSLYYLIGSIVAYVIIGLSVIYKLRSSDEFSGASLIFALLSFNIIPFFTGHFWWSMLASLFLFFSLMSYAYKQDIGRNLGSVGSVFLYFYMVVATLSCILYAILF